MIRSDRILSAVMIVLALGYILSATQLEAPLFVDPKAPKLFPFLVGGGIILTSIVMLLRPDEEPSWPERHALISILIAAAVMAGYAFALKPLGFLIPTAIASAILSYQLSPRPTQAALTGLGLSVGLFLLFRYALKLETLRAIPKDWLG